MRLQITICVNNRRREKIWVQQLQRICQNYFESEIEINTSCEHFGQLVLLDNSIKNIDVMVEKIERKGRVILLVVTNKVELPELLRDGRVDDLIVSPFRPLEVFSRLCYYVQILMWKEVHEVNSAISEVIHRLQEDFHLVERLQKEKAPKRFVKIRGFHVNSHYLSGLRSGGDYFDLAESKDAEHVSILLSDSSSYGLSSAVLSAIMRVTLRLTNGQLGKKGAVAEVVRRIYDDLLLVMKDQDSLSLFYGTISREQQKLWFLNFGSSVAFYANPGEGFKQISAQRAPISRNDSQSTGAEEEISLEPQGRLVLLSQGYAQEVGSDEQLLEFLNRLRACPSEHILNELTFRVKSKLAEDELPARDCSAIVFDIDPQVVKLHTL